jgi:hypothetical protein
MREFSFWLENWLTIVNRLVFCRFSYYLFIYHISMNTLSAFLDIILLYLFVPWILQEVVLTLKWFAFFDRFLLGTSLRTLEWFFCTILLWVERSMWVHLMWWRQVEPFCFSVILKNENSSQYNCFHVHACLLSAVLLD